MLLQAIDSTMEVPASLVNNPALMLKIVPNHEAENIEGITNFLSAFYGNAPGALGIWEKQNRQTRWFLATQRDEAAKACLEMADQGLDVYYGVGLQEKALTAYTRGTTNTVGTIPGFWVDIDIAGPGHSSSDLPPTVEDALQILKVLPFEPSVIVHSGGGLHAYWLFNDPWVFKSQDERSRAQSLSNQFQLVLRQEATRNGWKLDSTSDLARVLRVPYTKNFKVHGHPTDVVIQKADYALRYDPQEFVDLLGTETRLSVVSRLTEFENGPGNAEDILNNCRFIQHCRDDSQRLSEPDWHAMITVLHAVEGGEDLIHRFSDNYHDGSWDQTEQKIQEARRAGIPCGCSHIKDQLGFECPENGCNVASPISFANNASVVARLRINQLLPRILHNDEICFEQDTLKWLDILNRTDPLEWHRFTKLIKGKVNQNNLKRAMKELANDSKQDPIEESDFFSSLSDLGNSKRLITLYVDQLKYCNQTNQWYQWGENRWIEDLTQQVKVLATKSLDQVSARAKAELHGSKVEEVLKWCDKSRSNSSIKAIVEMTQFGEGIPITLKDFDQDPYFVNCLNGTYNYKTGILQPHNPTDLISKIIPCNYDPEAKCPEFNRFLENALYGDKDAINYLAIVVGILLSGIRAKNFYFVHGLPDTGKSMFIALLKFLLGDYGKEVSMDMLYPKKDNNVGGANPELFRLQDARGVFASETDEGRRIDSAFVKRMTGGDAVPTRTLYSKTVEFTPYFKLWIHGNDKPYVSADDKGVWNRLVLIPFNNVIPPDKKDPKLLDKLKAELPGILTWAIQSCRVWIEAGEKHIEVPKRFKDEAEAYRVSTDTLGLFLEEICILGPTKKVAPSALYKRYKEWCNDNGHKFLPGHLFKSRLEGRGFKQPRNNKGRYWVGIDISSAATQFNNDLEKSRSELALCK